jgi:1,4-dihydroxy-2-naphthoate octaprenyltransferase
LTPTEVFNWRLFGFAILTTLGLQILSTNDYGDGIKGTDNEESRTKRAIQSGVITPQAMKRCYYNYISIDIVIGYVVDLCV